MAGEPHGHRERLEADGDEAGRGRGQRSPAAAQLPAARVAQHDVRRAARAAPVADPHADGAEDRSRDGAVDPRADGEEGEERLEDVKHLLAVGGQHADCVAPEDPVLAGPAADGVRAHRGGPPLGRDALVGGDLVRPAARVELVGAGVAEQHVVAAPAPHVVVAVPADQLVAAPIADQHVVAVASGHVFDRSDRVALVGPAAAAAEPHGNALGSAQVEREVAPGAAVEGVGVEGAGAGVAVLQAVVAVTPDQDVAPAAAVDALVRAPALDAVVAAAAAEEGGGRPAVRVEERGLVRAIAQLDGELGDRGGGGRAREGDRGAEHCQADGDRSHAAHGAAAQAGREHTLGGDRLHLAATPRSCPRRPCRSWPRR